MLITVDTSEVRAILQSTPADQNVMFVGRHGIGKSEIVRQHFQERKMRVIPFFLGQMSDPGDLIGLLHKDEATGRSVFLPPQWWPGDDQPVVLFLDELNRARPEILQSVMELTLSKTLAGKTLPKGSIIVSAVNDGDEYQLSELDPALLSRFNVYEFRPTVDDWIDYASSRRLDRRVINFILDSPHWLDGQPSQAGEDRYNVAIEKAPDRRAWTRVAAVIDGLQTIDDSLLKLIAGIVGGPATAAFRTHLQSVLPIDADDIFSADIDAAKRSAEQAAEMTIPQISRLNERLCRYIARAPNDASAVTLQVYLESLQRAERCESVAHFVSLTLTPAFEKVQHWIAESIELTSLVANYLEAINNDSA